MTSNRRSKQSARQKAAAKGLTYAQATGDRPAPADAEYDSTTPSHMRSREAYVAYRVQNEGKPLQLLVQRYLQDPRMLSAMKFAVGRINADYDDDAVTEFGAEITAHRDSETGEPRLDFGSEAMQRDFEDEWEDMGAMASLLKKHGDNSDDVELIQDDSITDPVEDLLKEILRVAGALRLPTDPHIFGAFVYLNVPKRAMHLYLRDGNGVQVYDCTQRLDLVSQRETA